MNKTLLRSASFIIAIVLALGFFTPGRATSQAAALLPNKTVNLAYFYKPPTNSDAATVAANFSTVFLTGGDENFVNQMISNGYAGSAAQYFRSEGIQDPGNCTSSPANNQIANRAGDFCNISQNHPDWFLLDANGNRMKTSPTSNYYRVDYGNPGWQQFFVTRLIETQQGKPWNGVFLDNLEASLSEIQNDGLASAKYPDDVNYQAAVRSFLQYLKDNYSTPYGRSVVANVVAKREDAVWYDYMNYMTAGMKERWAVDWDSPNYISESKWINDLTVAETTQSNGGNIILIAQGDKADTNRQQFAFASYLLIANGKAAFRYANEDIYSEVWLYDNYKVNLGSPIGARYQTGSTWRRDFTNGYVTVDPVNHTATISTSPAATATATKVPVTSTPTKAPTLTMTGTPTQAPTLTVTRTPTKAPTLAATKTPTKAPTKTSTPSTTTYDNKNAAFVYSSGWTDVTESHAYSGSFKLTQTLNSSVTFSFTGQKFSVIYKTGPLFGKMNVYVDGTLVGTINQYTATATFQKKWSYGGTLTAGTHKLKLVYASPSGARVSVDAVSIP
jgi:hypothetical protein